MPKWEKEQQKKERYWDNTVQGTGTKMAKCEFCEMNGLVITGTIFPHKEIHKATWTSPNGRTKSQIDYTMIVKECRLSIMDTVVRRGADVGSDHYLVQMHLLLHSS